MKSSIRDISGYLKQMVKTILVVTGLHSIAADDLGFIVADSAQPETYKGAYLSQNAVLMNCMKRKEPIVLRRPRETIASCINCKNRESCDVISTIHVPILDQGIILGALTLHADTEEKEENLLRNEGIYLEFLKSFAELVANHMQLENDKRVLKTKVKSLSQSTYHVDFDSIIGSSAAIAEVKRLAKDIAPGISTVMLSGESGTGKEIFARAIHSNSSYRNGPFIPVNCAAIPENLLESELFGYEEGAFTGSARGGQIGKFELANHGTLFLDEIGEIPLPIQAKLLRAIQEKRIQRLGSGKDIPLDFRIISATNRDLESMTNGNQFRKDLYYRLNVIPIYIPPLRERKTDIMDMLGYLITRFNNSFNKDIRGFTPEAQKTLLSYDWPGNVRELQNAVEYAMNMTKGRWIGEEAIPATVKKHGRQKRLSIKPLREVEIELINEALEIYGRDTEGKKKASRELGVSLATLYRKIKEYQLENIR